jgi:hypothetical protein
VAATLFPAGVERGYCVLTAQASCGAGDGDLGDNAARAIVEVKARPTD